MTKGIHLRIPKHMIISIVTNKVIPYSGDEPSNVFEAAEKEGEDAYWFDFDNTSIDHFEYDAEKHEWTFTKEGMRVLH
jgi:hypothetical protein|tara:strand:- start:366 stop:599 length:234 start_codon:yes stop_codon:yes gene_type:complete